MHSCSDNDIDLNVVKIQLGSKELATTLKARLKFGEKKSLFNCCGKFFHKGTDSSKKKIQPSTRCNQKKGIK